MKDKVGLNNNEQRQPHRLRKGLRREASLNIISNNRSGQPDKFSKHVGIKASTLVRRLTQGK